MCLCIRSVYRVYIEYQWIYLHLIFLLIYTSIRIGPKIPVSVRQQIFPLNVSGREPKPIEWSLRLEKCYKITVLLSFTINCDSAWPCNELWKCLEELPSYKNYIASSFILRTVIKHLHFLFDCAA